MRSKPKSIPASPFCVPSFLPPEPKPLQFPIKFKVFLRLVFGGRYHAERLRMFRKYWCFMLKEMAETGPRRGKTDEARLNQASEIIAMWNREGVDEDDYRYHSGMIPKWRKQNRSEQRRAAALSRWKNPKQKS